MTSDALLAFQEFRNRIPKEKQDKVAFLMHTQPMDENGTDLRRLVRHLMPECNVVFSENKLSSKELNQLYNIADVTINIASNEGFGLGTCESLMTGTPIIVNVTGGLQDQCGFKNEKGEYLTADDYIELGSNHRGTYLKHGEWVKPVFPTNRSLQGSPMTPYIFDDRCDYEEAGQCLLEWYKAGSEERERCGNKGIEFVKDKNISMDSKEMCGKFIESMDSAFNKFEQKPRYIMEAV